MRWRLQPRMLKVNVVTSFLLAISIRKVYCTAKSKFDPLHGVALTTFKGPGTTGSLHIFTLNWHYLIRMIKLNHGSTKTPQLLFINPLQIMRHLLFPLFHTVITQTSSLWSSCNLAHTVKTPCRQHWNGECFTFSVVISMRMRIAGHVINCRFAVANRFRKIKARNRNRKFNCTLQWKPNLKDYYWFMDN